MENNLSINTPSTSTLLNISILSSVAETKLPNDILRNWNFIVQPLIDKTPKNPLEKQLILFERDLMPFRLEELRNEITSLFKEISELPREDGPISLLREIEDKTRLAIEQLEAPPTPLPEPDTTGKSYDLYQKRTNAVEHLEKAWGKWLKRFNPSLDRDYLHQDELDKRDPDLMMALRNQVKYQNSHGKSELKLRDIIPPKKSRLDNEIKSILREKPKDIKRIISTEQTRDRRR